MISQQTMVECPYNKGCVCPSNCVRKDCIACGWHPVTSYARKAVLHYRVKHDMLFVKEERQNAR